MSKVYQTFNLPGEEYYKLNGNPIEPISLCNLSIKEIKFFKALARSGDLEQFVDNLLSNTSQTKFNVDRLVVGDRIFLFYMLRALTFGKDYSFKTICSGCFQPLEFDVDIFEMNKKTFDPSLSNPIKKTLKSGITLDFILPTREIEKQVIVETKTYKNEFPAGEPPDTLFLAKRIIKSVNGDNDPMNVYKYVEDMPLLDWFELDEYIQKVSPGLDLDLVITCDSCGKENKEKLSPYPDEFFRITT